MGNVYAISLVIGGFFVLSSIFFGGGDVDADMDVDIDIDADVDLDMDLDLDVDGDISTDVVEGLSHDLSPAIKAEFVDGDVDVWIPFFSLRFWIFGSAFFGLTGTVLSILQDTLAISSWMIHASSVVMGLIAGIGSAYLFRILRGKETNSIISGHQLRGSTAHVLLPVDNQNKGKVYIISNGERIDFIASTDEETTFEKGDEAFVLGIFDGEARIVKMNLLEEDNPS